MAKRPLPSPELLRQLLRYDPETGRLYWLKRNSDSWNILYSGNPTFTYVKPNGYLEGCVDGRKLSAHRVVWALVHGYWPQTVDHINGDKKDNRICNLRDVPQAVNNKNKPVQKNNSSGVNGVFWSDSAAKWQAVIRSQGKRYYLGVFSSLRDAKEARKAAELKYGFNENHGRKQSN